ncbi:hypothetical protein EDD85DRAFT_783246 [Armillaria nabsnona]|nr:hypothetical protein EDD85DRAFT_783246 [Armillaria nabsnona]
MATSKNDHKTQRIMPRQRANLANARRSRHPPQSVSAHHAILSQRRSSLKRKLSHRNSERSSQKKVKRLEKELESAKEQATFLSSENKDQQLRIHALEQEVDFLCEALKSREEEVTYWVTRFHTKSHALQCLNHCIIFVSSELDEARKAELQAKTSVNNLAQANHESDVLISQLRRQLVISETKISYLSSHAAQSQKKIHALETKYRRSIRDRAKVVTRVEAQAKKRYTTWTLYHKGAYTPVAWRLAWVLVKSGCSQESVGRVIHEIGESAGLTVIGEMDRRTVERTIIEGGIASQIQLGHEMAVSEWRAVMTDISLTFQHSPLAQREHLTFCVDNFARKLRGLGFDNILDLDLSELLVILDPTEEQMIEEAGGRVSWTQLSDVDRSLHQSKMMERLAYEVGARLFDEKPEEERHDLELMFWGGCVAHKDMNVAKGGCARMAAAWEKSELDPPVSLPNKNNDAAIHLSEVTDGTSAVVRRALDVSSRGGIKLTSIAGSLFNHKDEKKGQQDTQLYHRQH